MAHRTADNSIDTRSLNDLYNAAKEERSTLKNPPPLRVLHGGDAGSQGDGYRAAWAKAFPDIPLHLTILLSKYHDVHLDQAHFNGENIGDVVALQTLHDFPRWKSRGRLLWYKPKHFEDLLRNEKDPDGAFLPTSVYSFGTFYFDSNKLPANKVPPTFESLSDPVWKDKLILTYPNDDDAVCYLFSLIVTRYGESWLHALATNNVQWVRGTGTPCYELVRQHDDPNSKRCLTFTGIPTGSEASWFQTQQPSAPEQIMAWPQTAGILSDTPQPETAKLFMAWITSPEMQSAGGTSTLTSVNKGNRVDLYGKENTLFTGFRLFEEDRARVEWWKNLFEDYLGMPQGEDPLKVYPNPPFRG